MAVGDTDLSTCSIRATISAILGKVFDLRTATDVVNVTGSMTLSDGTGANAGNQQWTDQRTLASGANEELDMYGTLTNAFGDVINFARVRCIFIRNLSTTDTLLIGGAASNAFSTMFASATDILVLGPATSAQQSFVLLCRPDATGYVVTTGTGDKLKIAHGSTTSTSLSYDVTIIGEV